MKNSQFDYQNAIKDQFSKLQKNHTTGKLSKFLEDSYTKTFEAVMTIAELSGWQSIDENTFRDYFESIRKEVLANTVTKIDTLNILSRNKNTWLKGKRESDITWSYTERYLKHLANSGRAETVVTEIVGKNWKL
jgi:hypothetical protein